MFTLKDAKELCKKAHAGQYRRDGITPYHTHPFAVADLLTDEDAKIVALLHDVIEDTEYVSQDLRDLGIPNYLVNAIEWLTKIKGESYGDYLSNIKCDEIAIKVKIADMIHNLSDNPTEKQKLKYRKGLAFLLDL
jgi:(p)ppGpp synthase/HD superfamily hydrolase